MKKVEPRMRIGVIGPISLPLLADRLPTDAVNTPTYSFPWMSHLVRGYLDRGYKVDVFTLSEHVESPVTFSSGDLRIFVGRRRVRARHRALDFFKVERADLREMIDSADCDVLHAHWLAEFALAALACDRDALVTAHDSPQTLLRYYSGPYWWIRAAMGWATVVRSRNLSAVSTQVAREIKLLSFGSKRIPTIPNGIPPLAQVPTRTSTFDPEAPVFATISNGFDVRKNTRAAIQAFQVTRRTLPGAKLIMFGNDHQPGGPAANWASDAGADYGVEFAGPAESELLLSRLQREVDVLVHPSRWEASSIAILEAQQAGVPVIGGARSGGVPDSLRYGESGILVDITKPSSIAAAMIRLASDPGEYSRISRSGIQLTLGDFSLSRNVERYIDYLANILASRTDDAKEGIA